MPCDASTFSRKKGDETFLTLSRDSPLNFIKRLYIATQVERRRDNIINSTLNALHDSKISPGAWYRFWSPGGYEIIDKCPPLFSCGTQYPIWLDGKHPDIDGTDAISYYVCQRRQHDCCASRWVTHILNCSGYYVYKLHQTSSHGYSAYCAVIPSYKCKMKKYVMFRANLKIFTGTENPCPPEMNSENGFTPGCTDNFPKLDGQVKLTMSQTDPSLTFFCDFRGRIDVRTVLVADWYVTSIDDNNTYHLPVWTDHMVERKRSVLKEEWIKKKLGSNVYCEIRSKWKTSTSKVLSRPIRSETLFAGIKLFNRIINVTESGGVGIIQLQSTIPVICLTNIDESNCKIIIEFAYNPQRGTYYYSEDEDEIVSGDCSITLTPKNWKQVHNISVKAVRDFMNDGNKKIYLNFRKIFTTVATDMWNEYQIPSVEIMVLDVHSALCSSYGDPHIQTFDKTVYDIFLEGEFLLYSNENLRTKVHIRTQRCFNAACNCAVAVAVDDDVIVIDKCNRKNKKIVKGSNFPDGWNTLHRHSLEQGNRFVDGLRVFEHDEGRRYTIHTPSGSFVDMHMVDEWININVFASSEDFNSSSGLCGIYDGNPRNDISLNTNDYTEIDEILSCGSNEKLCQFVESWRVPEEYSLFGKIVNFKWSQTSKVYQDELFCTCNLEKDQSVVVCDPKTAVMNSESDREMNNGKEINKNIHIRGRTRYARDTENVANNYNLDSYFDSEFIQDSNFHGKSLPILSLAQKKESQSYKMCENSIKNNAGLNCVSADDIKNLIETCYTDVQLSGSFDWKEASKLQTFKLCIDNIAKNSTLWIKNVTEQTSTNTTKTKVNKNLLKLCLQDCHNNGKCENRKCFCNEGFEGEYCNVNSSAVPQNLRTKKICDFETSNCNLLLVEGKTFMKSDKIICSFKNKTDSAWMNNVTAIFETFQTILCPSPYSNTVPLHIQLAVIIAEKHFFKQVDTIFVYDSKCLNCTIENDSYKCFQKGGTCYINQECYANGNLNPSNCCEICNPSESNSTFTARRYESTIVASADANILIKSCSNRSPMTFRLQDPPNCNKIYLDSQISDNCNSMLDIYYDENDIIVQLRECRVNPSICLFNLTLKDQCRGHELQKVNQYNFYWPGTGIKDECEGKYSQSEFVTTLNVKVTEIVYEPFQASHSQSNDGASFEILKMGNAEVSVDVKGIVTYQAPSTPGREQFRVIRYQNCVHQIKLVNVEIKENN
ncbi:hypothetical protein HELRODRAFT_190317 [Helobdella robusta]|uniref:VWFD domain-containing protein n=1 Tax=Helobdella robusta TaxID=6412 RepID=T1FRW5_HELRO|nr:hypothetical protein HELRODRAFT_190317 [Helobdella robusta]ESO09889.1 hypothetical protein HELRODRAFT_190317 [Helobdella robusta]